MRYKDFANSDPNPKCANDSCSGKSVKAFFNETKTCLPAKMYI